MVFNFNAEYLQKIL